MKLNTIDKHNGNVVQQAQDVSALFTLTNVLWEAQTKDKSITVEWDRVGGLVRITTDEYYYDFEDVPFTPFNNIACHEVYRDTLDKMK